MHSANLWKPSSAYFIISIILDLSLPGFQKFTSVVEFLFGKNYLQNLQLQPIKEYMSTLWTNYENEQGLYNSEMLTSMHHTNCDNIRPAFALHNDHLTTGSSNALWTHNIHKKIHMLLAIMCPVNLQNSHESRIPDVKFVINFIIGEIVQQYHRRTHYCQNQFLHWFHKFLSIPQAR